MQGLRPIALAAGVVTLAASLALPGCDADTELGTGSAQTTGSERAPRGTKNAIVTKNTDGDTLRLSGIGRVRLIGVDTPEVYGGAECYGREASAFTKRVLPPGTRVRYRFGIEPRDRYGRALAYIWLRDGRFFNLMLVERGYAQVLTVPPNVDYADRFLAAQRRARANERGLWAPGVC
jgi:micrococcal nuclease